MTCFSFSSPLCCNSPLKAELVPKTATKKHQRPLGKGNFPSKVNKRNYFLRKIFIFKLFLFLGGKYDVRNQPLTFHSKVKSSGYASAPPRYGSATAPQFICSCCYFTINENITMMKRKNSGNLTMAYSIVNDAVQH